MQPGGVSPWCFKPRLFDLLIDSFNLALNTEDPSLKDRKPANCNQIPEEACGVAPVVQPDEDYLNEEGISFPYLSSYWKYQNDIDFLSVNAGCSLIVLF